VWVAASATVVTKVGTPVNNQIGVWTGDGTLEGDSGLTWDGSGLAIAGSAASETLSTDYMYLGVSGLGATWGSLSHTNFAASATSFALTQRDTGRTIINSAAGQDLTLRIGGVAKFGVDAAGDVDVFAGNLDVAGTVTATALATTELAADPADPAEGANIQWQSDGTGSGDDGDIMLKITAGGVTKTITLVDYSAF
jgi:hypothetical protein